MDFYVYINGQTHKLVQGFTINEEYNETLDSASIIISNSSQLDINPYDDVFIFGEYCGIYDVEKEKIVVNYGQKFVFKGYPVSAPLYLPSEMPYFYKHFLINEFVENIIILGENESNTRYEYTIDLFSETKGLESVQAPNISITQPLQTKTSTIDYINRFLQLYNKRTIKANGVNNVNNWSIENKYHLGDISKNIYFGFESINASRLEDDMSYFDNILYGDIILVIGLKGYVINNNYPYAANPFVKRSDYSYYMILNNNSSFSIRGGYEEVKVIRKHVVSGLLSNVDSVFLQSYSPDFSLNNPSLRQILEKLFITKDCIPVVYDSQIYALDITKRRGKFDLNKGDINYIRGSKSSANYCTDLKRTYNNALTQENSSRYVEFLGFRNSDNALLTLDNLRIETRFPIYKINKIYMCYFKKSTYFDENDDAHDISFLCKQNITKLVKLNSERNCLSEDIDEFNSADMIDVENLSKYKLATIGYDIGSNYIDGWGTKYTYPRGFFWQTEVKSYIENIFEFMDLHYPWGIYDTDYLIKKIIGDGDIPSQYGFSPKSGALNAMIIPSATITKSNNLMTYFQRWLASEIVSEENVALRYKHLFFEIDYQGFYNGTVVQSKGLGKDNITINDNPSSSLTLLEFDGLFQKEKLDRYGNKGISISARYKDLNDVQSLGSVYEHNNDTDVIIYHKDYSINDNVVTCSYLGTKDYVLKDYFTSVYAKHRTHNLMSYSESVLRSENTKIHLLISKKRRYVDDSLNINFTNFDTSFLKSYFSFFEPTILEAKNRINEDQKINYAFFGVNNEYYATDINVFVSGTSLCLNMCMVDNVAAGVRISDMTNEYVSYKSSNYMIGATQKWLMMVDDLNSGEIEDVSFYFGHILSNGNKGYIDEDTVYGLNNSSSLDIAEKYNKILSLPKIIGNLNTRNLISFNKNIYKDNKERIDMTLQIQPIPDDDIFISPWISKLSNLFSVYEKQSQETKYVFPDRKLLASDGVYIECSKLLYPAIIIGVDQTEDEEDDWFEKYNQQVNDIKCTITFEQYDVSVNSYLRTSYTYLSINVKSTYYDENEDILYLLSDVILTRSKKGKKGYKEYIFYNKQLPFEGLTRDVANQELIRENFYESTSLDRDVYKVYYLSIHEIMNILLGKGSFSDSDIAFYTGKRDGQYHLHTNLELYSTEHTPIIKEKNLYWVYTPKDYIFREYMVYDELDSLENFEEIITNYSYFESMSFLFDDNDILRILHPSIDYGSYILCYYKNNDKFNFVFGFKPDADPNNPGETLDYTDICLSLISFKDLTIFDTNSNMPICEVPSLNTHWTGVSYSISSGFINAENNTTLGVTSIFEGYPGDLYISGTISVIYDNNETVVVCQNEKVPASRYNDGRIEWIISANGETDEGYGEPRQVNFIINSTGIYIEWVSGTAASETTTVTGIEWTNLTITNN